MDLQLSRGGKKTKLMINTACSGYNLSSGGDNSLPQHAAAMTAKTVRLYCNMCSDNFPTRDTLLQHMATHRELRLLRCLNLLLPTRCSHGGTKTVRLYCNMCSDNFPTRDALLQHGYAQGARPGEALLRDLRLAFRSEFHGFSLRVGEAEGALRGMDLSQERMDMSEQTGVSR
jgi:hypothetical protein